jgi:hypothetical protein
LSAAPVRSQTRMSNVGQVCIFIMFQQMLIMRRLLIFMHENGGAWFRAHQKKRSVSSWVAVLKRL